MLVTAPNVPFPAREGSVTAGANLLVDEETNIGGLLSKKVLEFIHTSSGVDIACRLAGQTPEIV